MSTYPNSVAGSAAVWPSEILRQQGVVSYASLVDLARMQLGNSNVEICDACNTVNLGSAHCCKACLHKLPAYYAAREEAAPMPRMKADSLPLGRVMRVANRASFKDFAAFALVINLLIIAAECMPVA